MRLWTFCEKHLPVRICLRGNFSEVLSRRLVWVFVEPIINRCRAEVPMLAHFLT
jgi:hypothetical protein